MGMMRLVVLAAVVATATLARALPVELRDQNGTRYYVNSDVQPFENISNASGALANATYVKPVTVTSYYIGFTPWFGFATIYTVQRQVDVPLTNGFAGFNGLVVTSIDGTVLGSPRIFNPGEGLAAEECPQNGAATLRPDSWIPPYNLACLDALRGDAAPALASLDDAVARGLASPDLLDDNEDFASLRATPQWGPLMARVQAAAILRPSRR